MYVVDSSVAVLLISMSIFIQLNYFHSPVECTVSSGCSRRQRGGQGADMEKKKKEKNWLV